MPAPPQSNLTIRPATSSDAALLLQLIKELADYERLSDEVVATVDQLNQWIFGPHAIAGALIAEVDGQAAGYAVYVPIYSTFAGVPHMYLEDIYVRPQFRRQGVGEAIMQHVAALSIERGCSRLDWVVLDWNDPAINFYRRLGARPINKGWTGYSIAGEPMRRLAAGNP